jgi:LmbE family N-acetylglucosaminyl deacetylase
MGEDKGMILQEAEIVPYHVTPPPGERVLVLAPHPDDETLGCGGTLRLLTRAGKEVKVVFLTSGDRGDPGEEMPPPVRSPEPGRGTRVTDYSLAREKEAERALRVLGVSDYEFFRFPDRGVHEQYHDALHRVMNTVEEFMPDTIYAPSMVELNPDHRATAALSMEIQRRCAAEPAGPGSRSPVQIVFYEVTTPLRPNVLVDITPVYRKKKRAMKRYRSQLLHSDYLGHIMAMNTLRALTVNGARYVEAFWRTERPMSEEDIADWLSYRKVLDAAE